MGPSRPATIQRGHPTMRLGRYTSSSILCLTVLAFFPLEGKGQGVDLGEDAAGALFPFVGTGKSTSLNTQESPQARFDWARTAWDLGRYVEALEELERLLVEGRAPELVPAIALLTGELYAVTELAVDGRAVRWAPDGLLAAYEVGTGAAAATRILELGQGGPREVASVPGTGLVSSPGVGPPPTSPSPIRTRSARPGTVSSGRWRALTGPIACGSWVSWPSSRSGTRMW